MIHSTPRPERPRERCLSQGPRTLSLRECIALILGSGPRRHGCLGVAQDLLGVSGQEPGSDDEERAFFEAMQDSPETRLTNIRGLGPAGRAKLIAAFELGRRYALFREKERQDPADELELDALRAQAARRVPAARRADSNEWLGFVPLFKSGKLGEFCVVSRGSRERVELDPTEFFARLLALRPYGYFVFHNHPSGRSRPSVDDHDLTRRLTDLSRRLGVVLLGHGVVTPCDEQWIDPA